jgi:hypothetical protein
VSRRSPVVTLLAFVALLAGTVSAKTLPNVDALAKHPVKAHRAPTAEESALLAPGKPVQYEERFGVPTFVWTAPSSAAEKNARGRSASDAARSHLSRVAALYGLTPADVAAANVSQVHDTGRGGVIVKLHEEVDGIEVFREEVSVIMNRSLERVAVSGYLSGAPRLLKGQAGRFDLDAQRAVAIALKDRTGTDVSAGDLVMTDRKQGPYGFVDGGARLKQRGGFQLNEPARFKQVYFHLPESFEPAYYVELAVETVDEDGQPESDMYAYVVSAKDGAILFRVDQTVSDTFTYGVWADTTGVLQPNDSPYGNGFSPHPTGNNDGTAATFTTQIDQGPLFSLPNPPFSKALTDPWLPAGSTETVGNNVDAFANLFAPDGFSAGDFRAPLSAPGQFLYTYDVTLDPQANTTQQKAAITQLFYNNNFLHDFYYDAGFDEVARNAQTDNYGRGGLGNDSIKAQAQDFSGTNNANMSTPADGSRPRMRMYVFSGPTNRFITVNSQPGSDLLGTYDKTRTNVSTTFGAQSFDVTQDVVRVNPPDACSSAITNGAALAGKIAFVDRGGVGGTCGGGFAQKAFNVQSVGALAVIIANIATSVNPTVAPGMGGANAAVTIGALSLNFADGANWRTALGAGTVNARVFRFTGIRRDGDLDNQVVEHEWGHYLSNRNIGGGSGGLGNQQGGGMGEGWSDFNAQLLTVRPEDTSVAGNDQWQGVYTTGAYAAIGLSSNSLYFGIRRVPYSTDMTKDPLTFKHISNGNPIKPPFAGPCDFGCDGSNNAEVHNTGEVWATMLWECLAALLNHHPFDDARLRMRDYLVASLKMTPVNPTFTEARDAVLAVAFAADPADHTLFCNAFAKRGAGTLAVSPDRFSGTNAGVVESYECANFVTFQGATLAVPAVQCDSDSYLDNFETATLSVTLKNVGGSTLSNTTAMISSTNGTLSFSNGGTMTFPPADPFQTTTGTIDVAMFGASGIQDFYIDIAPADPDISAPIPVTHFALRGNADDVAASSATETAEARISPWTLGGSNGTWSRDLFLPAPPALPAPPFNYAWHAPDQGSVSDLYLVSPTIHVTAAGTFTFKHRYSFENTFDGGVVEISTDGGAFTDIGAANLSPTYAAGALLAGSPLGGRRAYTGNSAGYPALVTVTGTIGAGFVGHDINLRFRAASDSGVGGPGWDIDDLDLHNIITATPFAVVIAQPADTSTPVISNLSVDPTSLWPPNHTMRDVTVSYTATDNCPVSCTLSVASNEPVDGTGDGDSSPDWNVVDDHHVQLRAERSGSGNGRTYTITVSCSDPTGNTGTASANVVVLHNITSPNSGAAFKVGSTVSFAGLFADRPGTTHTAKWLLDGLSTTGTVTEPTATKPGKVAGSYKFKDAGVYAVQMSVTSGGVTSTSDTVGGADALVVVYDPAGGYVTGGGTFFSPAGAYAAEPDLTGKIGFGFVSKYFKNATNPKGETELDFHVGSFKFNALNFDYLVVDGARAQYKGFGKVNGAAGYGFILTAIDGQLAGDGIDRVRMKIWEKTSGRVVYDTQPGAPDNADPSLVLDGDAITIQP